MSVILLFLACATAPDSAAHDTASDGVDVTLLEWTEASGCWAEETLRLDATWWSAYADDAPDACDSMVWTVPTTDGRCFYVTHLCGDDIPTRDPLISADEDAAAACQAAVDAAKILPDC